MAIASLQTLESQTRAAQAFGQQQGLQDVAAMQAGANLRGTEARTQLALANLEEVQANSELKDLTRQLGVLKAQRELAPEWQEAKKQADFTDLLAKQAGDKETITAAEIKDAQRGLDWVATVKSAIQSGDSSKVAAVAKQIGQNEWLLNQAQDPDSPIGPAMQAIMSGDPVAIDQVFAQAEILQDTINQPVAKAGAAELAKERRTQAGKIELERVKGEEARKTAAAKPTKVVKTTIPSKPTIKQIETGAAQLELMLKNTYDISVTNVDELSSIIEEQVNAERARQSDAGEVVTDSNQLRSMFLDQARVNIPAPGEFKFLSPSTWSNILEDTFKRTEYIAPSTTGSIPSAPQEHIDLLRSSPTEEMKGFFKQKYGYLPEGL